MSSRDVLRAYRELLILIKRLPKHKINKALDEARETVQARKHETDPQKASDYLKDMVSRISYLRMITPRRQGDRERFKCSSGCYVLRDGELVEGSAESKGKRLVMRL